jgi:hypothetical protein
MKKRKSFRDDELIISAKTASSTTAHSKNFYTSSNQSSALIEKLTANKAFSDEISKDLIEDPNASLATLCKENQSKFGES